MKKALILSAALLLADSPQEKVEIPNLPPAPITTVRTQVSDRATSTLSPAPASETIRHKLNVDLKEHGSKFFFLDDESLGFNAQLLPGYCRDEKLMNQGQCPTFHKNKEDVRKEVGVAMEFVRLQGRLADSYTINRIFNNYHAKVSSVFIKGLELVLIEDIGESVLDSQTPDDIRVKGSSSNIVEKLNNWTILGQADEQGVKMILKMSENALNDSNVVENDFQVSYKPDGTIASIKLKGKMYNPKRFVIMPDFFKTIEPDQPLHLELGNLQITLTPKSLLQHFSKLEEQKQNQRQYRILVNKNEQEIEEVSDSEWFTESDGELYKKIVGAILEKNEGDDDTEKLRKIATWLQENFKYMYDAHDKDIPKIAVISMLDGGGDCEDGYIAYKTLANAAGLGHLVAAADFPAHRAPLIQAPSSQQTYELGGATWTPVNIFFSVGKKAEFGAGEWGELFSVTFPDGTFHIPEGSAYREVLINAEKDQPSEVATSYTTALENFQKFILDNRIAPEIAKRIYTLDERKNPDTLHWSHAGFLLLVDPYEKEINKIFYELSQAGEVSEIHYAQFLAVQKAISDLGRQWKEYDKETFGYSTLEKVLAEDTAFIARLELSIKSSSKKTSH